MRICHCKAYNGIRENIKQAYAEIADRRKKANYKSQQMHESMEQLGEPEQGKRKRLLPCFRLSDS